MSFVTFARMVRETDLWTKVSTCQRCCSMVIDDNIDAAAAAAAILLHIVTAAVLCPCQILNPVVQACCQDKCARMLISIPVYQSTSGQILIYIFVFRIGRPEQFNIRDRRPQRLVASSSETD